jgi:hypothetical protein
VPTTKDTEKVSQSEHVRRWLKAHRSKAQRMPKAIVEGLAAEGIKVSLATVNYVKSKLNKGKGKGKATTSTRTKASDYEYYFTADNLISARKFADSLGGIENARAVLDALVKLQS